MLKIICLFIIISSLLYCSDNVLINKNIIQFPIKCNNKLIININCKEEKEKKLGQELFNDYKNSEKKLKTQLNNIFVPEFMSKSFKIDLDLEKINSFKIAYIYTPEEIKGINFKIEWNKQLKISSSFKKEFDISKIIENVSGVISNTFIPE